MDNLGKNCITLFLNLEDPIAVYIINNKMVLFNSYGGAETTPYKAYTILQDIVNYKEVDAVFPRELISLLRKRKPIKEKNNFQQNLVGWKESQTCYLCFDLNLIKDDNEQKVVRLNKLIFMEHEVKTEIQLSVKDALFIFANICANSLSKSYDYKYLINKEYSIDQLVKKQYNMVKKRGNIPEFVFEVGTDITRFAFNYLEFIRKELKENNITPRKILNLSGALVLVNALDKPIVFSYLQNICKELIGIERLSSNQLIVDYTFLKLAVGNTNLIYGPGIITETLKKYYDVNRDHLDRLEINLKEEYPFSKKRVLKLLGN
ncbi:MAG: hypothetical protein FK730_03375 [Asgard group archaeon]|nr:hypothetical protein [Asgard group archaeon]